MTKTIDFVHSFVHPDPIADTMIITRVVTTTSVTILWNEIPGATSYQVFVTPTVGSDPRTVLPTDGNTALLVLNNLFPGRDYLFTVQVRPSGLVNNFETRQRTSKMRL